MVDSISPEYQYLLSTIKEMHFKIVRAIGQSIGKPVALQIISEDAQTYGDVSYSIDIEAEEIVLSSLECLRKFYSVNLVMEGISKTQILNDRADNFVTIIIDPIDGTREIMYNKRSAWILTGIAFTETPTIKDIIIAVQTEIPISKQNEFSFLYAVEGEGAYEEIYEKSSMACVSKSKRLLSGQAEDLKDGFVCFPNPFPGTKLIISSIYEDFYNNVFPHKNINEAKVFSDEYISTGGHVYLLASGCYRIVADLREHVQTIKNSLCCHPYDLCTVLLAIEAGAQISDISNHDLSYPLDTTTNCNWIGFSNIILKRKYGDLLLNAINKQKAIT